MSNTYASPVTGEQVTISVNLTQEGCSWGCQGRALWRVDHRNPNLLGHVEFACGYHLERWYPQPEGVSLAKACTMEGAAVTGCSGNVVRIVVGHWSSHGVKMTTGATVCHGHAPLFLREVGEQCYETRAAWQKRERQWRQHDARITCYVSEYRSEGYRHVETVHETRRDGSCQCGQRKARPYTTR